MNNFSLDDFLSEATCAVLIGGQIAGTAWLVSDEGHLLTAGHVLCKKLELCDEVYSEVEVQFGDDEPCEARQICSVFQEEKGIDFAVLKLSDLPGGRQPLPISLARSAEGEFRLYGYGETMSGDPAIGMGEFAGIVNRQGSSNNRLFRLRSTELVDLGFSGGAVYSEELGTVVAIQIEAGRSPLGPLRDTVLAMPLYRVAQAWEPLKGLAERATRTFSEDGQLVVNDDPIHPPLPEFDSTFLAKLEAPGEVVKLRDELYVKRQADALLKREIVKLGTTITIQAPRQSGKTSLLVRGIHHAKKRGHQVVFIDFQGLGRDELSSRDIFLRELAMTICRELALQESVVDEVRRKSWKRQQNLTYFLQSSVLPQFEKPIILAMDKADRLLEAPFYEDFFGLVRSWHNRRATHPEPWEKLNIVFAISTEPHYLVNNPYQSPFNVGQPIGLTDFTASQISDLNQQHGSPVAENELPQLMALLGGQPYLTRQALYTMATQDLTWSDLARKANTNRSPFADHLRGLDSAVKDKPKLKDALREVIRSGLCSDETACRRLLRAGLIKNSGHLYTCRCNLYKIYFEHRL